MDSRLSAQENHLWRYRAIAGWLPAQPMRRRFLVVALSLYACSDQSEMPVDPGDTMPPSAVQNLHPIAVTDSSVTLEWTAPGNNGAAGTASIYDLRYSESPIGEDNWSAAGGVADEPAPLAGGTTQTHTVSGLADSTTYYFALRTFDEAGNASELSRNATATTRLTVNPYGSAEYANRGRTSVSRARSLFRRSVPPVSRAVLLLTRTRSPSRRAKPQADPS